MDILWDPTPTNFNVDDSKYVLVLTNVWVKAQGPPWMGSSIRAISRDKATQTCW